MNIHSLNQAPPADIRYKAPVADASDHGTSSMKSASYHGR